MNHKLDTDTQVFFYENDFYVLSNFSAFTLQWEGIRFDTSEHVYHWEKFPQHPRIQKEIQFAKSAHDALDIANYCRSLRLPNWDDIKLEIMFNILKEKAHQHLYVYKKLLETGNRELIEDSWRDDFWGWGPNKDGHNHLGKIWMAIREDLRNAQQ
jgi:ribA/ribD-fused uncharacterized protein